MRNQSSSWGIVLSSTSVAKHGRQAATRVALQDRATESLATHSGVRPMQLATWAAERWTYGSWHRDVFHVVNSVLSSPNFDHVARRNLEEKVNPVRKGHRVINGTAVGLVDT